MKKIVTSTFLIVSLSVFPQQKVKSQVETFSKTDKTIAVFTSADSTNLRLTLTDNLKFSELTQPIEKETYIFVDPSKTFQTFLGIGGAITDASAEVFAKLPKNNQS